VSFKLIVIECWFDSVYVQAAQTPVTHPVNIYI